MTLISKDGQKPDAYTRVGGIEELGATGEGALVPLSLVEEALEALDEGMRLGVLVPNNSEVAGLRPLFDRVELIAVEFPSFSDGRGLSLAKRLRRAGFSGTLRACGPLIADEFHDVLACGFDEIELPETMANRQPVQQWMAAKDAISRHYQSGYGEDGSILQMRLAARKA